MSKIKVMDEQLSNRIAAGEVIERPASVVKELVENAIDAGATRIRIEIERAGSRLISVSDNGSGMDADDVLLCIEPHGTSKIFSAEDIDRITTLGFRGEALPSIASISRFTILSRTAEMLEGTRVRIEGGRLLEAAPAGCAVGTVMQVRDLFFNTPARKKFLKSPATEAHHIEEMVVALALPRPEVGFELRIDGRTAFHSPAAPTPEARLRELFGRAFVDNLWPVDHTESGITITGFTAAPGFTRNSRREQRTFVNGRAVESAAIYRGIREGYATLAESGRYAPAVLFLTIAPEEVDVNVHPAKREVRFKHEFAITRAVTAAIGNALKRSRETPLPSVREAALPLDGKVPLRLLLDSAGVQYQPKETRQPTLDLGESFSAPEDALPDAAPTETLFLTDPPGERITPDRELPQEEPEDAVPPVAEAADRERTLPAETPEALPESDAPSPEEHAAPRQPVRLSTAGSAQFNGDWPEEILGILDHTYILASGRSGLVLIDQHAAHERIMFERLLTEAKAGAAPTQALLLPQVLELPPPMRTLLLRYRKLFETLGFDIEPMGSNTVMLNGLPASMPTHRPLEELIPDILQELLDNQGDKIPVELEYVARAACRAAIKAHDELTPELAKELLRQLGECRQGTLCPHGRPTMVTLTYREIEKRFGRR